MFNLLLISVLLTSSFVDCEKRIIGGQPAKIENFKWQVALLYISQHKCGGSIITSTKILSAAHCVDTITNISKLQVRVGSNASNNGGTLKNVAKIIQHPDFNYPTSLNNDIAILILTESLEFGLTIGPIALAPKSFILSSGAIVIVSGYGTTSINSNEPDVLHYVSMPIVSQSDCLKAYSKYQGKAKVTNNMFCAGFYGTGGKDACKGDSGGPLIYNNNNSSPILYGVISWGNECADPKFPGVYTKVPVYYEWIININ